MVHRAYVSGAEVSEMQSQSRVSTGGGGGGGGGDRGDWCYIKASWLARYHDQLHRHCSLWCRV
jgi:hypothetical protein